MALDLDSLNKNKKSVIKFSEKKEKTLAPFERPQEAIKEEKIPSALSCDDFYKRKEGGSPDGHLPATDEIKKHGPSVVGEKTKSLTPEQKVGQADEKWAKVEIKTEKILKVNTEKTRRRRVEDIKCTPSIQKISSASYPQNPSRLDYMALRGDNKVLLNLIINHITDESPYWLVGTDELSRKCLFNESTLKTVIQRLKKKGFISVKRGVSERLFTVNPSILTF